MALEKWIGELAAPVGKEFHTNAPELVIKVVKGLLSSSIRIAKYACLRSKLVYRAFPCKNCNVAPISGITEAGLSSKLLIGL